jgi:hypothetical protein
MAMLFTPLAFPEYNVSSEKACSQPIPECILVPLNFYNSIYCGVTS